MILMPVYGLNTQYVFLRCKFKSRDIIGLFPLKNKLSGSAFFQIIEMHTYLCIFFSSLRITEFIGILVQFSSINVHRKIRHIRFVESHKSNFGAAGVPVESPYKTKLFLINPICRPINGLVVSIKGYLHNGLFY